MHYAVKDSIKKKNTEVLSMLLDIGFPMYEASDAGHSVLEPTLYHSTALEIANDIFSVFIKDHKFDILKRTTLGKKNLSSVGEGNSLYKDIFNWLNLVDMDKNDNTLKLWANKVRSMHSHINYRDFDHENLQSTFEDGKELINESKFK